MNLTDATVGREYVINSIHTEDEELNTFLFSLGCYEGERVTVVRKLRGVMLITLKQAKYAIDTHLARAIRI